MVRIAFLSRESRQSNRIFGSVLNQPLYDGDCSPAARELLAVGDVSGAIAEWRRLADLGSSRARCVLAYIALKGTPSPDLEEAERLASSALSGERGYANYLLGCVALKRGQPSVAIKYLADSHKSGFVPAVTLLASLALGGRDATTNTKIGAERLLRKAAAAGHRPAAVRLCHLYLLGRFGFAKRLLGLCLLPAAMLRYFLAVKYQVFAIETFHYSNSSEKPVFVASVRIPDKEGGARLYRVILRFTHIGAALCAAAALFFETHRLNAGSILLVAWPYALSFVLAAQNNARSLVGVAVQTLLLILITSFVCSAYLGQVFDDPLTPWNIFELTLAQSVALYMACGLAISATQSVEKAPEPAPTYRKPLALAHVLLGAIAAGSVFSRVALWRPEYLRHHAFDVISAVAMTLLPYVAVAVFSWRFMTSSAWKPWVYAGVLGVGTAAAVMNNSGLFELQHGLLGVGLIVGALFLGFYLAAEWALDDE